MSRLDAPKQWPFWNVNRPKISLCFESTLKAFLKWQYDWNLIYARYIDLLLPSSLHKTQETATFLLSKFFNALKNVSTVFIDSDNVEWWHRSLVSFKISVSYFNPAPLADRLVWYLNNEMEPNLLLNKFYPTVLVHVFENLQKMASFQLPAAIYLRYHCRSWRLRLVRLLKSIDSSVTVILGWKVTKGVPQKCFKSYWQYKGAKRSPVVGQNQVLKSAGSLSALIP